jgi:hypothetical protein
MKSFVLVTITLLAVILSVNGAENGQCETQTPVPCSEGCWNPSGATIGGFRNCSPVGLGFQSPLGDDSRYECEAGQFSDITTAATCERCPVGSFQAIKGSSQCEYCSAGSFCGESGCPLCQFCNAEYYNGLGSDFAVTVPDKGDEVFCIPPLIEPEIPATPAPTSSTNTPTRAPTRKPTKNWSPPSKAPTRAPTRGPTQAPVSATTASPTRMLPQPGNSPTQYPTSQPLEQNNNNSFWVLASIVAIVVLVGIVIAVAIAKCKNSKTGSGGKDREDDTDEQDSDNASTGSLQDIYVKNDNELHAMERATGLVFCTDEDHESVQDDPSVFGSVWSVPAFEPRDDVTYTRSVHLEDIEDGHDDEEDDEFNRSTNSGRDDW